MNKYICVSIGNSDNRLTQKEWHDFVMEMIPLMGGETEQIHFFGGSENFETWQNVAWVAEVNPKNINVLMAKIADVRMKYKQDSAFFMVADGMFI